MSIKRIYVNVTEDTILTYETPNKFKETLSIEKNQLPFPEGFTVTIGKNEYAIVKDFFNDVKNIPEIKIADHLLYTLQPNNQVRMGNGILVKLVGTLDVILPAEFDMILKSGTKLQQRDFNIKLTLENDVTVHIDAKCTKDKTIESTDTKDKITESTTGTKDKTTESTTSSTKDSITPGAETNQKNNNTENPAIDSSKLVNTCGIKHHVVCTCSNKQQYVGDRGCGYVGGCG